jgi:bifunctional DNA-binding transcriptional regulator/antitoxin component of YhaV-PrlF toxin-antitoxin module
MIDKPEIGTTKGETLSQIKLSVDADGKIALPKPFLERIGMQTGSEFLVKEVSGTIILIPMVHWAPLVEAFKEKIENRLKESGIKGDEPFFASLTVDEYAALSEEEEEALWEKLYGEASRKVKYEEVEVGTDFIPA